MRHLELPNSCIVAALIYVQRALDKTRFTLSITNWQPCLLAAFVIAAKLSFDEPVWNEDFVKALRISNVQVRGRPTTRHRKDRPTPPTTHRRRHTADDTPLTHTPLRSVWAGMPDLAVGGRFPDAALVQHERNGRAVRGVLLCAAALARDAPREAVPLLHLPDVALGAAGDGGRGVMRDGMGCA